MQRILSKYGLAAHLALLVAAPLFLFPYFGDDTIATVVLCLAGFASIWVIMEPSRRTNEMLHDARFRVIVSIVSDPLFWFSLFLIAAAAVMNWNNSVSMAYDAEASQWYLSEPSLAFLPGSVKGAGYLTFSGMVAMTVLLQGARHALGRSARISFYFMSSFLAGVAAVISAVLVANGDAGLCSIMECRYQMPSFVGSAFGFHFIASILAIYGMYERNWKAAMMLLPLSIGGSGLGLFLFSPPLLALVFVATAVLALLICLVYAAIKMGRTAAPKVLVLTGLSLVLPVLMVMFVVPKSVTVPKIDSVLTQTLIPEGLDESRKVLSGIAEKAWKDCPWLGTGLGSFGYDIRFKANSSDWDVIDPIQSGALNGWWEVLAERGIIGGILVVLPFFFLLWTWVRRLVAMSLSCGSGHGFFSRTSPACWIGLIVIAVGVLCGFGDHTFIRTDSMLAMWMLFAMSGSSFPLVRKEVKDSSEG